MAKIDGKQTNSWQHLTRSKPSCLSVHRDHGRRQAGPCPEVGRQRDQVRQRNQGRQAGHGKTKTTQSGVPLLPVLLDLKCLYLITNKVEGDTIWWKIQRVKSLSEESVVQSYSIKKCIVSCKNVPGLSGPFSGHYNQ